MGCHSSRYLCRDIPHRHCNHTTAEAAADKVASTKEAKYRQLANSDIFVPVAVETMGTWNDLAVELIQQLCRRISAITHNRNQ